MTAFSDLGALGTTGLLALWVVGVGVLVSTRWMGDAGPGERAGLAWTAGSLSAWAVLVFADDTGLGWSPGVLGALGLVGLGLAGVAAARPVLPVLPAVPPPFRAGWGDVVAAIAAFVHARAAFGLWNLHPDFVYHWGLKAGRHAAVGAVDWDFLARPWEWTIHPEYPDLVILLSTVPWLGGDRSESGVALYAALLFGLVLLATRDLLERAGASPAALQMGMAGIALFLLRFTLLHGQTGGADWWIVLAWSLGAVALLAETGFRGDARVGLACALAVGAKAEGLIVAGILVTGRALAASLESGRRGFVGTFLRAGALPLAAALLWAVRSGIRGVPEPARGWVFSLERAAVVARELWAQLTVTEWHLAPVALFVLPVLAALPGNRRVRLLAGAVLLQVAAYAAVYTFVDVPSPDSWIQWSARRLVFHVMPVTLALFVVALDRASRSGRPRSR